MEMNTPVDIEPIDACMHILRQETTLLERLAAAQVVVRNAVFARDWTDLEAMLARLDGYGREFEILERERARLFSEVLSTWGSGRDSIGFYTLVSRLPEPRRREITDLYRRLKLDTLKVRLANDALTHYLTDARETVASFLDAAFPDRRGKIYSRRGTQVHAEMRSIVLDRNF